MPQSITQNENSSVDKNNNEENFKINKKESENLVVPKIDEFNDVPTKIIKITFSINNSLILLEPLFPPTGLFTS